MGEPGIEPGPPNGEGILSPSRLPVPPLALTGECSSGLSRASPLYPHWPNFSIPAMLSPPQLVGKESNELH